MNTFKSLFRALATTSLVVGAFMPSFAQKADITAQPFTIKGTIPGIKNGTKVSLRCQEKDKSIKAECLSKGNSFILSGKVAGTMLVMLQINDKPQVEYKQDDFPNDRGGKFMLEAADYTVSAACFDSIPLNYDLQTVPMVHEKNLKIVGGKAQQQYQEWADATFESRLKLALLGHEYRNARFRSRKDGGPDSVAIKRLEPLMEQAEDAENQVNADFFAAHPDYSISLLLQGDASEKPFAYTSEELDQLVAKYANNYDSLRYQKFADDVKKMRAYLKGASYKDLALETPDGKTANLKDIVVAGKYNFIDFWASWCGPCRAAIPSVKQLYQKLGDKLNIVSVSVDKQKKDWERAMGVEKMPWQQYIVPAASMNALTDGYFVRFIPTLVVIDPEGKIQLYTGDPQQAHRYLEKHVR